MQLTSTTTQSEYLAHLRSREGNPAIAAHAVRVSKMNPQEWSAHLASKIEFSRSVGRVVAKRLVAGI